MVATTESGHVVANPGRQDAPRAEQVQEVRRRRQKGTLDKISQMRFQVFGPDQLDHENYVYRWVVDMPGRIHHLTHFDDYDFVRPSDIKGYIPLTETDGRESGEGGERIRAVANRGSRTDGETYAYFMKKRRSFWQQDNDELVEVRRAMMERRVYQGEGGVVSVSEDVQAQGVRVPRTQAPSKAYVPEGNQLGHGGERVINPNRRRGAIE